MSPWRQVGGRRRRGRWSPRQHSSGRHRAARGQSTPSRGNARPSIAFRFLLLVAPLVLVASDAIYLARGPASAAPMLWLALALFLGVVLMIAWSLAAEVPVLARAGAALSAAGLLAAATYAGIERVRAIVLAGVDSDQLLAVQRALDASAFVRAVFPASLLFPAGLILLGVALQRVGRIGRIGASALFLGAVLFPVARSTGSIAVMAVGDLSLLIGFGALALPVIRRHGQHATETSFA